MNHQRILFKLIGVFVVITCMSCSKKESEELVFLNPNEDLIKEKFNNGEIYFDTSSCGGVYKVKGRKNVYIFSSSGFLSIERWVFNVKYESFKTIDSFLNYKSKDEVGYVVLPDETPLEVNGMKNFGLININTNHIFIGTIIREESEDYKLWVDYYYPNSTLILAHDDPKKS